MGVLLLIGIVIFVNNYNGSGIDTANIDTGNIIPVIIPAADDKISLDSLIDAKSVKYIQLENNANGLVGRVDKVVVEDNKFFILDELSKGIFIFDKQGKFIRKIFHLGKKKSEYRIIRDFAVNKYAKEILIFDDFSGKLLHYNYNGDLLGVEMMDIRFRNIQILSKNVRLLATMTAKNLTFPEIKDYSFVLQRNMSDIFLKAFKNSNALMNNPFIEKDHFSWSGKDLIYSPRFKDTIYTIDSDGVVKAKYNFVYRGKMPKGFIDTLTVTTKYQDRIKDFTYFMGIYQEDANYSVFRLNPPGYKYAYCFYDKDRNHAYRLDKLYSWDANIFLFSMPVCSYGNQFITPVYGNQLVGVIRDVLLANKYKPLSNENRAILQQVTATSNPLLMFYSFK